MSTLGALAIEAQNHPDVARLARDYSYTKMQIGAVYMTCRGDIETVELIVRLATRPIESSLIAAIIDVLRSHA